MRKRWLLVLPALIGAALVPTDQTPEARAAAVPSPADQVAKLTGPGSINDTEARFALKATDLGILWDNGAGEILTAFGDSYGSGWTGPGGGVGDPATIDWRCNLLFRSKDRNLADGMSLDSAAEDRPGHAETVPRLQEDRPRRAHRDPDRRYRGRHAAVRAVHVGQLLGPGRQLVHQLLRLRLLRRQRRDLDQRPERPLAEQQAWDNKFQMVALVRDKGYVYMIGTPNGRFGNAHIARVPEKQVLSKNAWRYWDGRPGRRRRAPPYRSRSARSARSRCSGTNTPASG